MRLSKYGWPLLVLAGIAAYASFFSYLTIVRYRTLNSSYFDLGLMHQAVYNTYRSIESGDRSRFLELTDPHPVGLPRQITRMAIHNDLLLVPVALFYFIYPGIETLLILKSLALAAGAWAVFGIARIVWRDSEKRDWLAFALAAAYLLYPPLHRLNLFDFQAVSFAVPLLLFMALFALSGRYGPAMIMCALALLAKENVALTTLFFGGYFWLQGRKKRDALASLFGFLVTAISIVWFAASFYLILPAFRSSDHYALARYQDFGASPAGIVGGALTNPEAILQSIARPGTGHYLFQLFGPLLITPLFAPLELLVAAPEFAINLLSKEPVMRTPDYHYAALLIPSLFFSAIYGLRNLLRQFLKSVRVEGLAGTVIIAATLFAYLQSPLPLLPNWNPYKFSQYAEEAAATRSLAAVYADEKLIISTTPALAPLFTGRRYFYQFSQHYRLADYVIVDTKEVFSRSELVETYRDLQKNRLFSRIESRGSLEVYQRL